MTYSLSKIGALGDWQPRVLSLDRQLACILQFASQSCEEPTDVVAVRSHEPHYVMR